jgi:hypothetical protein
MPLLRMLLDEGFTQGASAAAAGGGAGIAVKTGVAALLAAGTVTTGAVLKQELKKTPEAEAKPAKTRKVAVGSERPLLADRSPIVHPRHSDAVSGDGGGPEGSGRGGSHDRPSTSGRSGDGTDHSGSGSGSSSGPGSDNSGPGGGGGDDDPSGTSGSGSGGSGSSGPGSGDSGSSGSGSDGSDDGLDSSGHGPGGSGSDDPLELDH